MPLRVDDEYIEPEELPEVQTLIDAGWTALSDAPVDYLVPAVWPAEHRCWVPDRTPDAYQPGRGTDTYYGWVHKRETSGPMAWSRDEEVAEWAEESGLPGPPLGRRWLIRSPWPGIEVDDVLCLMTRRAEASLMTGGDDGEDFDQVGKLRVLLTLDGDEIFDAVRAELGVDPHRLDGLDRLHRELARYEIDSRDFERWRADLGMSANALLAWMNSTELFDADIVDFVRSWRGSGLPGDPPIDAARFVGRDLSAVRSYLDAGFTLYDADLLEHVGVARAVAWREAGFDEADTYELLWADPDLHIGEAQAFDREELRSERKAWIYWGFSAPEALAWSSAGLSPGRSRLWRAGKHVPSDVPAQNRDDPLVSVPPGLRPLGEAAFGWFAYAPTQGAQGPFMSVDFEGQMNEWEDVDDPPGTRGRGPRRRRGDTHPWIQTD